MTLRLALLIALTMTAFAANSVLNRMAVEGGAIPPGAFAAIRVAAGAATLLLLVAARGGRLRMGRQRLIGAPALAVYMIGFSLAYRTLDAGVGAVTSGLGYALWYAILPRIEAATAALVQLSAPVIAVAGGLALLGEVPSGPFLAGAALVLGGIAIGLVPRRGG